MNEVWAMDGAGAIGVIGAGGQALELAGYIQRPIAFFAVDPYYFRDEIPCVSLTNPGAVALEVEVVVAMGGPGAKRIAVDKWPGSSFVTVVAERSFMAPDVLLASGSIVAPMAAVMSGAEVGRHVLINTGAIVSHESTVGDFSTISPGATIGGRVRLGTGTFVGIGATILDGVTIGSGAVIGAGAVVTRDVSDLEVVAGVPARRLRMASDWLTQI